jgi:alpha-amylase/alpha-mannosidase (GH57 family)
MSTSENTPAQPAGPAPIHVAFVWHMHQPYYRSARTGAFQMPWARLHAIKDYLDMVEILQDYPTIHQTFNLVPSLVEQLEDYAAGGLPLTAAEGTDPDGLPPTTGVQSRPGPVRDVYWEHTIRPAADLLPGERAFVVERMCESPDHPRARSHPRYLELALKRQATSCDGWEPCAATFTVDELRDLQVWFNLAWFDPTLLEAEPLLSLVQRGRDFREEDKQVLGAVQNEVMKRVIPAYQAAAARGQVELSTTPYFHPILPLLANTDSARVGAGDTILPHRRFAHPEDAWEQVDAGVAKHQQVFGARPLGMWCSEQSVGEDVLPLLDRAGIAWTISDEAVLARSIAGSAAAPGAEPATTSPYVPYLLRREQGRTAIVFRDHTLSDLIGFGYQGWDSRDAANDLIARIRAIGGGAAPGDAAPGPRPPLITIALDGENAWEYYPHDGRDFLHFLYEGLAADPAIRCVTISEHLKEYPAETPLDWLHTGSWIGGDLRTWSGDLGHNAAWDLLHDARDLAAAARRAAAGVQAQAGDAGGPAGASDAAPGRASSGGAAGAAGAAEAAWHHIMVAEGSDWFWWFGEHHHTELDYVWDLEFRQHLQEVYLRLGQPVPIRLYLPVFAVGPVTRLVLPLGTISPEVNGRITDEDGWDRAGLLPPDHPSTMQRTEGTRIVEARFGWGTEQLFILLIPRDGSDLEGLEIDLELTSISADDSSLCHFFTREGGRLEVTCPFRGRITGDASGAWQDVVEIAVPLRLPSGEERLGLTVRVGRGGMVDHIFRSAGLAPVSDG